MPPEPGEGQAHDEWTEQGLLLLPKEAEGTAEKGGFVPGEEHPLWRQRPVTGLEGTGCKERGGEGCFQ